MQLKRSFSFGVLMSSPGLKNRKQHSLACFSSFVDFPLAFVHQSPCLLSLACLGLQPFYEQSDQIKTRLQQADAAACSQTFYIKSCDVS